MDAAELLRRVRRVEISTRGLSDKIFAGEYHSAFKGRGMAFSENREYHCDHLLLHHLLCFGIAWLASLVSCEPW